MAYVVRAAYADPSFAAPFAYYAITRATNADFIIAAHWAFLGVDVLTSVADVTLMFYNRRSLNKSERLIIGGKDLPSSDRHPIFHRHFLSLSNNILVHKLSENFEICLNPFQTSKEPFWNQPALANFLVRERPQNKPL